MLSGFKRKAVFSEMTFSEIPGRTAYVSASNPLAKTRKDGAPRSFPRLLADAEFPNDSLVALGIVSLEVVEQATPLADQHEQAAA